MAVVAVCSTVTALLVHEAGRVEVCIASLVVGEIFRQGIDGGERQAVRHAPVQFHLQGFIVGLCGSVSIGDLVEVREWIVVRHGVG